MLSARYVALLLLPALASGCFTNQNASAIQALPSADECHPRTENWVPECSRLFLKDYNLHGEAPRFEVDDQQKLSLTLDLHAWRDAGVTIMDVQGFAGHSRSTNSSMLVAIEVPAKLDAGDRVTLRGTSADTVSEETREVFYGLRIQYRDTVSPDYDHYLLLFNRCFGVDGSDLVPLMDVSGPAGARLMCSSADYLLRGEVSDVAVIVHDFQTVKHAFPAAEDTEFWSLMS